ncbi:MAG: GNAT family N-acetyltransferase [Chloroherpetonaceae bacterium]|nr:GNAT family N-acetyltransferase [Chloroherpetonaceae bacterium]MDW8437313.1 GNAT family N-acetyltransferase [Chloroherpetonaceae bacterium]
MSLRVKKLAEEDFETFFSLIVALADYEGLAPPDSDAKARLKRDAFSDKPRFEAYLAFLNEEPVGYAIAFETYSSFLAKPTLHLEDLFVLPSARKKKVGFGLFKFLAELALERGCGRMEWQVLNWNQLAIDFYEKLGAERLTEWLPYRLTEERLRRWLSTAPSASPSGESAPAPNSRERK